MNPMHLLRRWRDRRRYEAELAAELDFHLECRAQALREQGVPAAEAWRRARVELGAVETHKDGVRAAHGLALLDAFGGELRRTLAGLLRAPLFLAGATVVLALATALNLVMFAVHQTYAGTPPATLHDGALFDLELRTAQGQGTPRLTHAEAMHLCEGLGDFARHVAITGQTALGSAADPPQTLHGMAVDSHYFRLLARRPLLGRSFEAGDDADPEPRIVLGHAAWTRLAAADPGIVGRELLLGGSTWTVIGVMPDGFGGLEPFQPQFWIGARAHEDLRRHRSDGDVRYGVTIQLAPEVSRAAVEQRAAALLAALPTRTSDDDRIASVRLLERTGQFAADESEDAARVLVPLYGLLLLVLLIACANLANLMLARALARRRELAIRASIGASRLRLIGLLMLEAALLALLGAGAGLLLAFATAGALHDYAASAMSGVGMQALDVRVPADAVLVALGLAVLAMLAIGLVPSLAATRGDLAQSTRTEGGSFAGRIPPSRLRAALVVLQVAASTVLLVLAAIGVRIAHQAGVLDVGYPTQAIMDLRHPAPTRALMDEIARTPGVQAVASMAPVPLYGHPWPGEVVVDGHSHRLATHHADHRVAAMFGLRLRAGRWFDEREARTEARVAVVGSATAARLWPGQSALGRTLEVVTPGAEGSARVVAHVVIGVVDEVATGLLVQGIDRSALWLPGHAEGANRPLREHVLRIDPALAPALAGELSRTCLRHTPGQPCTPWRLAEVSAWQRLPLEIARGFALGIGVVALLISAAGLWGGVAYTVAARTHEIGVRRALGALGVDVLRLVLAGTLRQLALGLALAAPACIALAAAASSLSGDGLLATLPAFAAVALLLLATTLVATALPARRATAIAPTEALREI